MDNFLCWELGPWALTRKLGRQERQSHFQPPGGDEVARFIRAMLAAIAARAICLRKQTEADERVNCEGFGGWASNTNEQQISSQQLLMQDNENDGCPVWHLILQPKYFPSSSKLSCLLNG